MKTHQTARMPLSLIKRKVKIAFAGQSHPREITAEDFYLLTGYRLTNSLEFASACLYEEVKNICKDRFSRQRMSLRSQWLGVKWRKPIGKGFVEDVSIRWINDRVGFGLFAEKPLKPNTFIGEYLGVVRKFPFVFADVNACCFRYPLYNTGLFFYSIDAENVGNEISFANHSTDANMEAAAVLSDSIFHIALYTVCAVQPGEELTFDYGNNVKYD